MSIEALYHLYLEHPLISTDSRNIEKGALFFAIKGERFDGNQFAQEALEKGAAFAIVDDPSVKGNRMVPVKNTLKTLQALATYHRHQFDIPVLGITGSNGKTTTKELVRDVLQQSYQVHATPGNYNNHIGVPLTLLMADASTDFMVIEMGANAQGEIALLSSIACPDYGLITNIGKAHLEGFGGVEGIKKGKSELYRFLDKCGGTAFINMDEPFLWEELRPSGLQTLGYGQKPPTDFSGIFYSIQPFSEEQRVGFQFEGADGKTYRGLSQLEGAYNFGNIATAIALGLHFEVPPSQIVMAIENYFPKMNRSQVLQRGDLTILLDAYNANPTSMEKALRHLSTRKERPRTAILGDMLELGEASTALHTDILELAVQLDIDQIVLMGPRFASVKQPSGTLHFPDKTSLTHWWREKQHQLSGVVLIKGSRRWSLETLMTEGDEMP